MGHPLSSEVIARALVADRQRELRALERAPWPATVGPRSAAPPGGRYPPRRLALRRAAGHGLIRAGTWLVGERGAAGLGDFSA